MILAAAARLAALILRDGCGDPFLPFDFERLNSEFIFPSLLRPPIPVILSLCVGACHAPTIAELATLRGIDPRSSG